MLEARKARGVTTAPTIGTLFEDRELVVRALPGDPSKPTLVTFGSAGLSSAGPGFWGSGPAGRMGWPAIGFMAHRLNWYPAASMAAAAEALRGRLGPVALGYGYSMGGYAALRYGRLLGLTHALALSPQASISPADLPQDIRYHVHFDPVLHAGMLVGPGHPPPRAWVIFDPDQAADAANRALLSSPGIRAVPVRGMYHSTVQLLASLPVLEEALEAVLADDPGRLRRLLRARQRSLPFWHGGMGASLVARGRPRPGSRVMERARSMGLTATQEEEVLSEALAMRKARVGTTQGDEPYAILLGWLRALTGLPAAAHLNRSLRLAEAGLFQESRQAAEQGLAETGPHVGLLTHLGHITLSLGKHRKALSFLEEAVRLDPEEGWAWVGVSLARLRLADAGGAEDAARTAVRLRPGSPHAGLVLGEALLALGRPAEAVEALRDAVETGGGEGAVLALGRAEAAARTAAEAAGHRSPATWPAGRAAAPLAVPAIVPATLAQASAANLPAAAAYEALNADPLQADDATEAAMPPAPAPDPILATRARMAQEPPPSNDKAPSAPARSFLARLLGRA